LSLNQIAHILAPTRIIPKALICLPSRFQQWQSHVILPIPDKMKVSELSNMYVEEM
jgi:hypothetical protein